MKLQGSTKYGGFWRNSDENQYKGADVKNRLLQGNKIKKLETHLKTFEERLEELKSMKSKVQEFREEKRRMLEKNEPIEEWSSKHEAKIWENDALIEEYQNRITELKERENKERRAEEDQIEEERLKRKIW